MHSHKIVSYRDSDFNTVSYCSICGQETDLNGECPGEYQFTKQEKDQIEQKFNEKMKEIFR